MANTKHFLSYSILRISVFLILLSCFCSCSTYKYAENGYGNYVRIPVGPGPEDIYLDTVSAKARLLISCTQRRKNYSEFGEIVVLDLNSLDTMKMIRVGEPDHLDFKPHGIDGNIENGELFLYVVNHDRKRKEDAVLKYRVDRDFLEFRAYWKEGKIRKPNDVAVTDTGFVFTRSRPFIGSVVACNDSGDCKVLRKMMHYPNGVETYGEDLIITTSLGGRVLKYSEEKTTLISKIKGGDNLFISKNTAVITSFPSTFRYLAHYKNPNKFSPSGVHTLNLENQVSKTIYSDPGKGISTASGAIIYKNKIYISQVFNDYILMGEKTDNN